MSKDKLNVVICSNHDRLLAQFLMEDYVRYVHGISDGGPYAALLISLEFLNFGLGETKGILVFFFFLEFHN